MSKPNIICLGAPGLTCQVKRIEEGLTTLGVNTGPKSREVDYVYCNDSGYYDQGILIKQNTNAKLILNVLDIPAHLPDVAEVINQYKIKLAQADIITCISVFVQKQIKTFIGLDAVVIYNPIQDITFIEDPDILVKKNAFLYVGRAEDPNKRFGIAVNVAQALDSKVNLISKTQIHHPAVNNLGQQSVEQLSRYYNESLFLLFPSKVEGLGLPPIEAFIGGCIPILLNDNTTASEFFPAEFITDLSGCIDRIKYFYNNRSLSKYYSFRKMLYDKLHKTTIAKNILNLTK